MTYDEFIEKYGDVKVKFSYYYKYNFSFIGLTEDGNKVCVTYGESSDDIYKFQVTPEKEFSVSDGWNSIELMSPSGETLFAHYE